LPLDPVERPDFEPLEDREEPLPVARGWATAEPQVAVLPSEDTPERPYAATGIHIITVIIMATGTDGT
jgi:hypothetical protein